MNAKNILQHLDNFATNADLYTAIVLDSSFDDVADTRMSVFRSDVFWQIFFEIISCERSTGDCTASFYAYGNVISQQGLLPLPIPPPFEWIDLNAIIEAEACFLNSNDSRFSIFRHGEVLTFTPTVKDFVDSQIALDGVEAITPTHLLRFLCHHLSHPFFASEGLLRYILEERREDSLNFPSNSMKLFLQTFEWQHFYNDELPSDILGFRLLANSIASGDIQEWHNLDQSNFNTHWRFIDEARKELYGDMLGRLPGVINIAITEAR